MTTTVTTDKTQPAVNLNKIHWEWFGFKQPILADGLPNTVKSISGAFTHYGFPDGSTERVYDKESIGINLANADEAIITNHVMNGGTVEGFMIDYAAAVAQVNTDYLAGNISDALMMAYLELIMARSAEIDGKLTIASVE